MSEAAICQAVLDRIKTVLTLPNARCIDIRPDGSPTSGITSEVFIAVSNGGQTFGDLNNAIDEYQAVDVTISLRTTREHVDYWGRKVSESWERSMTHAVRKIIGAVHLNPDLINAANSTLETEISSPFIEMLRVKSVSGNQKRTAEWWGADAVPKSNPIIGYSRTIQFGKARRIQSMDSYS